MDQGSVARLHSEAVTNSICSVPLQIHRALIPDPTGADFMMRITGLKD